ncbi:MAG: HAMP domain-containing sensor histidine kinase, partial [Thiohalophilus sp.]|jgi:signal transduction histidine kinase
VHGYVSSENSHKDVPAPLRQLSPGWHNLHLGEVPYRLVIVDRQGERYFLLHDTSLQERRENRFLIFLGAGVLLMALLSSVIGFWLSGRVIAPVTQLAQCVRSSSAAEQPVCLAEDFPADEVGELARVFEHYVSRLRAFVERERLLAADLSHELRTPLAVIQGAAEVLLDDESLSQRNRERLVRIERACQEMTELGSALLLMAKEDSSDSPAPMVLVAEVLQESLEKHRYLLQDKPVEVSLDIQAPDLRFPVERALLFIVISNLLRNAFTYTEQGEVQITLSNKQLVVVDTGSGIPSEHQALLFQRHLKGASRGAGIGLSLVKRICERYHWSVQVQSQEGAGTSIKVGFA